jgi:hypothetical protein
MVGRNWEDSLDKVLEAPGIARELPLRLKPPSSAANHLQAIVVHRLQQALSSLPDTEVGRGLQSESEREKMQHVRGSEARLRGP